MLLATECNVTDAWFMYTCAMVTPVVFTAVGGNKETQFLYLKRRTIIGDWLGSSCDRFIQKKEPPVPTEWEMTSMDTAVYPNQ